MEVTTATAAIEEFDFLNWDVCTNEHQENCNMMQQEEEEEALLPCKSEASLQASVKPAKSRDDQYEASFPPTLLCTPYKYDLKLLGGALDKEMTIKTVSLELVDAETLQKPDTPETRPGVTLEGIENHGDKHKVFRFALNWCSFHFKKRAFCLKLVYKNMVIFSSTPFHTYARRRETPYSNPNATAAITTTSCKRQLAFPVAMAMSPSRVKVQQPVVASKVPSPQPYSPIQTGAFPMFDFMKAPSFFKYTPATPATTVSSPPASRQASPTPSVAQQPQQAGQIPHLFASMERTQMAIQLLSSLSPAERDAVNYYMSCQASGR